MKINVNISAILGAGAMVLVSVMGFLVVTAWANDKQIAVHETKLTVLEAMRPQVFDTLMKVDSIEKSVRELRDGKCNFKRKTKTQGD